MASVIPNHSPLLDQHCALGTSVWRRTSVHRHVAGAKPPSHSFDLPVHTVHS
eukprot:CAMPEP_0194476266 /NCGR_PEP_ID=MMETSP0253-20130528/173_1 /TAXON_ID=2966 /ORGANISM="Noctiluca scintillans" /LENGTH=51 /DNA_ID=CAMNT_0039315113 /DNA_START=59 /DNA_END=214 /DNA_ORIENTATION=-